MTALAVVLLLSACAFGHDVVNHSFGFDVRQDDQDSVVLDYRYGDSKLPVRPLEWAVKEGKTFSFNNVNGPMLRGEFLYVKWRNKSTGNVYEDRADLRNCLPRNIEKHKVYFMVRGSQLYVYLISPDPRPPEIPAIGPTMYRSSKVIQLYPDEGKQ